MFELFAFPLVVIVSTLTAFVVFLIAKLAELVECKFRQKMKEYE